MRAVSLSLQLLLCGFSFMGGVFRAQLTDGLSPAFQSKLFNSVFDGPVVNQYTPHALSVIHKNTTNNVVTNLFLLIMFQISEKINKNFLGLNFFNPKHIWATTTPVIVNDDDVNFVCAKCSFSTELISRTIWRRNI